MGATQKTTGVLENASRDARRRQPAAEGRGLIDIDHRSLAIFGSVGVFKERCRGERLSP